MKRTGPVLAFGLALLVAACSNQTQEPASTPDETPPETDVALAPSEAPDTDGVPASTGARGELLHMQLEDGLVVIRLRPDLAPNHVARVKSLAAEGFYDGTPFHRVIDGFMAQGGDPSGTGTGGSDLPDLGAEFSSAQFTRGVIGAARTNDPDSANSQFFIMFGDAPHLNGSYTVWGEVVSGMEHIDALERGEPVARPDRIVSMSVVEEDT